MPTNLTDAQKFYTTITGANSTYTAEQLEPQLRNLIVANISSAMGSSGVPFLIWRLIKA
jgi:membrane protease subunit (stomatin/prohibitin family)